MEYTQRFNGSTFEMTLKGKFTFADHLTFEELFASLAAGKIKDLTVDCTGLEFIDSAALAVFLLIRDETVDRKIMVTLKGATGQVQKMFELARFYDLFNIV